MRIRLLSDPHHTPEPPFGVFLFSDNTRSAEKILFCQTKPNMIITLSDHRKIAAIQAEFSAAFPYLKIDFFVKPPHADAPHPQKLMNSLKTLGECRTIHTKGIVTIIAGMSITELESLFRDTFGLSVLLSRKSGREWLNISSTDKWTLDQQNEQGKALSKLS
jgi:hypothetical protein